MSQLSVAESGSKEQVSDSSLGEIKTNEPITPVLFLMNGFQVIDKWCLYFRLKWRQKIQPCLFCVSWILCRLTENFIQYVGEAVSSEEELLFKHWREVVYELVWEVRIVWINGFYVVVDNCCVVHGSCEPILICSGCNSFLELLVISVLLLYPFHISPFSWCLDHPAVPYWM